MYGNAYYSRVPNRATELAWESPNDPPLRTSIIDAALAIADERGLEAVSIRRVGERIGCRPMALYTHLPSKDALVALMFERISGHVLIPKPLSDDGQELLRLIATRTFETYLAHPWMLHAFGLRPAPGPSQLLRAEQSAIAVQALGVTVEDTWAALSIVHEWTMGHALHAITIREDEAIIRALQDPDANQHPTATHAFSAAGPARDPKSFQAGLDTILIGIQARFTPDR